MSDKPSNPKDIVGIRKAPMSTVSAAVMAEVGTAMLEGAAKYGRHNFRAVGVRASVYYDATMRHLFDWWEGTDIDPDSGMHHITKAIASLMVLRDAMIQGKAVDDRPPRSQPFYDRLNVAAGQILDRHADKSPRHYTIEDTLERAWVPWDTLTGGNFPEGLFPETVVDVKFDDGSWHATKAGDADWSTIGVYRIVAWRPRASN